MTSKIIVIKGDKPILQMALNGDLISIGRRSDCDISIKDPAVSGVHARIKKVGEDYVIKDCDSTNGLHLRGKRVEREILKNNDLITIGEHMLKVVISADVAAHKDGDAKEEVSKSKPSSSAAGILRILSGARSGEEILLIGGLTTIGTPGIQVAAVSKRPQGYFIIHVDGGKDKDRVPLVNGEPTGFKSLRLEDGDKIEVAGIAMEYRDS
ncbi:MAG: pSer/pThr/pTyr-binding forkhead associated (FHA) protein [Candidatus Azotimanducaceae bacterium]|jgi:pSer/pThr/pTyr-binding forkhead associated (FHA) protein